MMTTEECESMVEAIVAASGGSGNLAAIDCCATRLRLTFADVSLARIEALRTVKGSAGLIVRGGEYQIVVGIAAARLCRLLRLRIRNVAGA
jgi:phosphotransferase system IIB component